LIQFNPITFSVNNDDYDDDSSTLVILRLIISGRNIIYYSPVSLLRIGGDFVLTFLELFLNKQIIVWEFGFITVFLLILYFIETWIIYYTR
jgi:hypothetical protein